MSGIGTAVLPLLAKVTLALLTAWAVAAATRRGSAAARHGVWLLALASLLALPVLSGLLPRWRVAILPPLPAANLVTPVERVPPSRAAVAPDLDSRPMDAFPEEPGPLPQARSTGAPFRSVPHVDAGVWAAWVWSAGVALGLLQFIAGTLFIRRTARRASRVEDPGWQRLLDRARRRIGLRRAVDLRRTHVLAVPVVWGWRRPVVLIPEEADLWSEDRRRAILEHELAHVVRCDALAQTLALLVQAIYWPHPLVWWAVRQLRREAERACDDRVLEAGIPAPEYARYLLDAARRLQTSPSPPSMSSAVVERTSLGDRLLALLDDSLSRRSPARRTVMLACMLATGIAMVLAALQPAVRAAAATVVQAAVAPLLRTDPPVTGPLASPLPAATVPVAELAITGTVQGPDGRPVANAFVSVGRESESWPSSSTPAVVRTDPKGAFRIPVAAGGSYWLSVIAPPLAAQELRKVAVGPSLAIVLPRGAALEGVVRESATRAPIANAKVTSGHAVPGTSDPDAGLVATTTDENGHYRLEGVSDMPGLPGSAQLTVVASGFARAQAPVPAGVSTADVFLTRGAGIGGVVHDADGKALANAQVAATTLFGEAGTAESDAQGHYRIDGLKPGSYRLLVRHSDWAFVVVPDVRADLRAGPSVDVRLERALKVIGRLLDAQGRPVRGRVFLRDLDGAEVPWLLARDSSTETSADGRFGLGGLPAGWLTLGIQPPGFVPTHVDVVARKGAAVVDAGDVHLEGGLAVRGSVRDKNAVPVPGATITARQQRDRAAETRSEPDGSFIFANLKSGAYGLEVAAEGFAPTELNVTAGSGPVKVVLQLEGIVTGSVVDESGQPLSDYRALARTSGSKEDRPPSALGGGDGRFRLEGVADGIYILEIQSGSRMDKTLPDVRVVAGRTTDVGHVVLAAGGSIRGTVVDGNGAPIAGAEVNVNDSESALRSVRYGGSAEARHATTDSDGRFELRGLPSRTVPLVATHPDYAASDPLPVEVQLVKTASARITLLAGGRIEGTAHTRDGQPMAGLIALYLLASPPLRVPVEADGSFALEHVAPGRREVQLLVGGYGRYRSAVSKQVEIRDGETSVVEFQTQDIRVSGLVTRGGSPLPQEHIELRAAYGSWTLFGSAFSDADSARASMLAAVSDPEGRYELIVPQSGQYFVALESITEAERSTGRIHRDVVVPDEDSFRFDIALPDWALTGSVVEKDSARPLADASISAVPSGAQGVRARARTAPDGRFKLAVEPATYQVRIDAAGHAAFDGVLDLSSAPVEQSFELASGASLKGQVDLAGGGVEDVELAVVTPDRPAQRAYSQVGGWFEIGGLAPQACQVFAAHDLGFALQAADASSDDPVHLSLSSGTLEKLSVQDQAGKPVANAQVRIDLVAWNGVTLGAAGSAPYAFAGKTDADGAVSMLLPRGPVGLVAWAFERKLGSQAQLVVAPVPSAAILKLAPSTPTP